MPSWILLEDCKTIFYARNLNWSHINYMDHFIALTLAFYIHNSSKLPPHRQNVCPKLVPSRLKQI